MLTLVNTMVLNRLQDTSVSMAFKKYMLMV